MSLLRVILRGFPPPAPAKPSNEFLLAEYRALVDIDNARSRRLDGYLTLFLTLAGSPWALYALILHEAPHAASLNALPLPLAAVFILVGFLGFLVMMMFVQVRFLIILYMRAINAIRGHFAADFPGSPAFQLPTDPQSPPYIERWSYIFFAVVGMAIVDAAYVSLGLYFLLPRATQFRTLITIVSGLLVLAIHVGYYFWQGHQRGKRQRPKLTFDHSK
jgi:hypothetical protein